MLDGSSKYFMPGEEPEGATQSGGTQTPAQPATREAEPVSKPTSEVPATPLPSDPEEFDTKIAPYRVMVRPLLQGISRMSKLAGTEPLDSDEKESGEIAFSALMYQYGGALDARVLVALWIGGVTVPRAIEYYEKQKRAERALPNGGEIASERKALEVKP